MPPRDKHFRCRMARSSCQCTRANYEPCGSNERLLVGVFGVRDSFPAVYYFPLLKHELAARAFVVRTLARLGLDLEPVRAGPGRPPGARGG